ncbi:MAG TPA: response regulator transcription factor, partial [Nitriliruptorales bacterium]
EDTTRDTRTSTGVVAVVATDDRPLLRAGLRSVVGSDERVDLVAECDITGLVAIVEQFEPAVIVATLRANDPDPFRAIATVKALSPSTRVLVIADSASVIELREAVIAGVDSFLLTTASEDDIRDAVSATAGGERVVSPEVAMQLAGSWRQEREAAAPSALTSREFEVLQLLAEGLTNQEVASRLGLSPRTIKTHVQNLLAKLDVPDRTGAVARGFRLNLIK